MDNADNRRADGGQDGVPLNEAARRLGLSPDALRKRLARGTLQGVKTEDGWRVYLPEQAEATGGNPDALVGVLQGQVTDLRAQTADLQRRLDAAEQDRAQLLQLVNQAQQLAAARLLPSPEAADEEPGTSEPRRRPAFRWPWQR